MQGYFMVKVFDYTEEQCDEYLRVSPYSRHADYIRKRLALLNQSRIISLCE